MATPRLCSIPDCGKPAKYKEWCKPHWERWRRHGDPLGGRAPIGEPERYFHEVVMAYEGDECLKWPFGRSGKRYASLGGQLIHRRVCEEANGPPPTPEHDAAHLCGHGHLACVAKRHLSWKTKAANQADRIAHGTSSRGEQNAIAKLTEADVHEIRSSKGKLLQREIASKFGVTQAAISAIHRRENWSWLDEK